ncbi:PREDICTED: antifungal protein ginkbilobin-2-like [Nelumbo nucifera]|nr:PREDICTED: antifungal protein ginkbilobin-2-like [Nelumbo nucifera]
MGSLVKMMVAVIGVLNICRSISMVRSEANTNVTTIVLCNSGVYAKSDPFAASLAYVLAELEAVTPSRSGHDYYTISPYPNAFAYGHAACKPTLSTADCTTCLQAAEKAIFSSCNTRIGARSVLHVCTIRYEQYPFTE